ncbi:unnamed protein product, partial [marine sediment metagenome]
FIINSKASTKNVVAFIESQPDTPVLVVEIYEQKKDRTVDQNRLYRLWGGIISDELGWARKDVYTYLRREHLCKIYERDDQGYAEMVNSIRNVWKKGMQKEAEKMHDYIVERTSSADATVKQFMEYLKQIEHDMTDRGIPLPHPEDRYNSAMGIKQQK